MVMSEGVIQTPQGEAHALHQWVNAFADRILQILNLDSRSLSILGGQNSFLTSTL
jgi:hypothetical protein